MNVLRRRLREAAVAAFLAVAPSTVPLWRLDPSVRPVAMLEVGEPMVPFPTGGGRIHPR